LQGLKILGDFSEVYYLFHGNIPDLLCEYSVEFEKNIPNTLRSYLISSNQVEASITSSYQVKFENPKEAASYAEDCTLHLIAGFTECRVWGVEPD
jgi:hypothetical protein